MNAVNNITQMIDGAGTHNYTYDTLDRLTAATHPNQANESYTYDDVGNRTASHQGSSYSYQTFNRLVSANGTSFSYDTNGNQTSKSDTSGSWTYSWDYENRLKQASLAGGVTVMYSYDALGRRVQRTSSANGTTKFIYDGPDVVRDLDRTNVTIADYLNAPGIDNKLRQSSGATASYFLTDRLSTTRALADASGNVISSLSYDAFGKVISGSASTRYTYTGREIDSDIDVMYYRTRWYERGQGRFASEDPIGSSGGDVNLYRYVGSNPVRHRDPLGQQKRSDSQTQPGEIEAMRRLAKAVQAMGNCPEGNLIYICCRDINAFPGSEILSQVTGVRHCFIKTPNKEAGMNPPAGQRQPIWPFGTPTEITDHTGQSANAFSCVPVCNVDERCVERELEIGKSAGKWSLSNNCNTFARQIVKKCQKTCQ